MSVDSVNGQGGCAIISTHSADQLNLTVVFCDRVEEWCGSLSEECGIRGVVPFPNIL